MSGELLNYSFRLVFALFIGGVIGLEREIKGKPAGMRTNMLMCMGSCLLMILSIEVATRAGRTGDPGRIAAQVVTGIGFLGAGTILRSRVSVTGLTSAATLWFVAALGLVIGNGDYVLAGVSALLIIITLSLLGSLETHLAVRQRRHVLQFRLAASRDAMRSVKGLLRDYRITPEDLAISRQEDEIVFDIEYVMPDKKHLSFLEALRKVEGVEVKFDY
jgi:putative Mg2+ transporter-C (MgtC) family protein